MQTSILSIRLGTEELFFLLWLLNTPSLPGMGANPFGNWTENDIAAALASAERSLRARRFIRKAHDGQILMDQAVMALIGTCAVPETSLLLTCETPQTGRVVHYFHATRFLAVEHTNPEPGIHLFEALADRNAILHRLETLLGLNEQSAPPASVAHLTLFTLQEATRAAQEGVEKAQAILNRAGMEQKTAQALAETLSQTRRRASLAVIHHLRSDHPHSDGVAILEGPSGLWAFQVEGEEANALVHLWPQSAEEIRARLRELLSPSTFREDSLAASHPV